MRQPVRLRKGEIMKHYQIPIPFMFFSQPYYEELIKEITSDIRQAEDAGNQFLENSLYKVRNFLDLIWYEISGLNWLYPKDRNKTFDCTWFSPCKSRFDYAEGGKL